MHREEFQLSTRGESDVIDLTDMLRETIARSGIAEGMASVFAPGATAGVTTLEFEPGCVADLKDALERVAPRHGDYEHNRRWGDGNGFSHIRAALLGPSLSVPVSESAPLLGTWQQVVLVDCDNRPRDRRIVISVH
ncbi:MAG: secondary thiamine-phosphate synthase enzyme YjbQ [Planctomycetota bacterium]|jgi:secondary thiamine-phosphate synthase enzyme